MYTVLHDKVSNVSNAPETSKISGPNVWWNKTNQTMSIYIISMHTQDAPIDSPGATFTMPVEDLKTSETSFQYWSWEHYSGAWANARWTAIVWWAVFIIFIFWCFCWWESENWRKERWMIQDEGSTVSGPLYSATKHWFLAKKVWRSFMVADVDFL